MRFLVDNSLSWRLSEWLQHKGHDAPHVRDVGLRDAADHDIYARANQESRLILTQDVDFSALLIKDQNPRTGIVLLRLGESRVSFQIARLEAILANLEKELLPGRVIVVTESSVRIRQF